MRAIAFIGCGAVALAACTGAQHDSDTGELHVALSSRVGDTEYHLRDAQLRIDGPDPRHVSLDGPGELSLTLPAGPHQLTLLEGWSLTREVDGMQQPVSARLLSDNPASLFVAAGAEQQLSFRFALEQGPRASDEQGVLEVGFELSDAGAGHSEPSRSGCVAGLRINEVDYDQQGSDDAEFIELLNAATCDASLDGVRLELLNGSSGEAYASVELGELGTLAPSGRALIADQALLATLDPEVPALVLGGLGLQNGPDSLRLSRGDDVLDVVGYGPGAPQVEGSAAPEDSGPPSIGRCPDGFDTQDNGVDFVTAAPTPGASNDC